MRTSLRAASVAVALLAPPLAMPAHAQGAIQLTCLLQYGSPVGSTWGEGTCTATGVANGVFIVSAAVRMSFDVVNGCPLGSANGTMTGALNVNFNWTRIGAGSVITTTGDLTGAGAMVFSAPCPAPTESAVIAIAGP